MKHAQRVLKNPLITTTWPLNDRADVKTACRKIQEKIITYGICSDREQAFLSRHTDFGKIDQKEAFY